MKLRLCAAVAAAAFALPAAGFAKVGIDQDFFFPTDRPVTIVVFRPDVQVGSMGVGGVQEPNAEWTATARTNLQAALERHQGTVGREIKFLPDQEGEAGQLVADYQSLFRAVAGSIMIHKFYGAKLPTKKGKFDWTLGQGATRLSEISGGDYALFLHSRDAYGTAGRKALQLFAGAFGVAIAPGIHAGYASLVDMKTGKIVWFNADPQSGGDPREQAGADKRVGQLLKAFPGAATVSAKKAR